MKIKLLLQSLIGGGNRNGTNGNERRRVLGAIRRLKNDSMHCLTNPTHLFEHQALKIFIFFTNNRRCCTMLSTERYSRKHRAHERSQKKNQPLVGTTLHTRAATSQIFISSTATLQYTTFPNTPVVMLQ